MTGKAAARLLAVMTAAMPPGRRDWGRAMMGELEHVRSSRERARLVLGAARVALLPPPGLAGYGLAAGRACLVAAVASIPLSTGLYLSNVVFPRPEDSTLGVLSMDAYVVLTLMAAGAAARRASSRPGAAILAGAAAGLIVAALGMATFAVIDNAFLPVVSHQVAKVDGFRASGLTSMRAYINTSLEATAPVVAVILALGGAFFGALGASADREIAIARSRQRASR
jgi:hypothetical protein